MKYDRRLEWLLSESGRHESGPAQRRYGSWISFWAKWSAG